VTLTEIHPHALAASAAAEAAALQDGLDPERFESDRGSAQVIDRIRRDVDLSRAWS
jgi:hypothetical protein